MYFYSENNKQLGPFTIEELKTKRIKKSTLVWTDGMGEWTPAEEREDLRDFIISEPPPLPNSITSIGKTTVVASENSSTNAKYDLTYEKDTDALGIGIVLILVSIGLSTIVTESSFDHYESYAKYRMIASVTAFIFRFLIFPWVMSIAKRQNRNATPWGWFGFFFPAIALIVISQQKKLRLNFQTDSNLSIAEQINILMDKVEEFYNDNRTSDCIELLNQALALDPQNNEALLKRATYYSLLNNYENSKADFLLLEKRGSSSEELFFNLGNIAIKEKDQEKAVKYWLKAKEFGSTRVEPKLNMFHNLTGKYVFVGGEYQHKLGFNVGDFKIIEKGIFDYKDGFEDVDNLENFKKFSIELFLRSHGIRIELEKFLKTKYVVICYYEMEDILHDRINKLVHFNLIDKKQLTLSYKDIDKATQWINIFYTYYHAATGRTASKEVSDVNL